MGSLGHSLQISDRPSTRLDEPSPVPGRVEVGAWSARLQPVLSCEQRFILLQVCLSFLRLMLLGGLDSELACTSPVAWWHALCTSE